ncbi:replication-relaxation family protein [Streptomyces sp. NPDC002285]
MVSEGNGRGGTKLWGLTPLGLEAASQVLARPLNEMGGIARGAGRSGAPHAMAVNETVIAITRTPAQPTRPVLRRGAPAVPAQPAPPLTGLAGIGSISAWSTEAAHTLPGGGRRTTVRADAVLHAPEAGAPVLLLEVDNCTESPETVAAKFDRYRRYFRLTVKGPQGRDVPVWRTLYPPTGREGHPSVAIVFNPGARTGGQALKNRMNRILDLTRDVWAGTYENMAISLSSERDGYYSYSEGPVSARRVKALRRHVRHQLRDVAGRIRWEGPRTVVATSRSFQQLGRLCGAAPGREGPFVPRYLASRELRSCIDPLATLSTAERAQLPGISAPRARRSLAGAVVAHMVMKLTGTKTAAICPWAIREGVLLRYIEDGAAWWLAIAERGEDTVTTGSVPQQIATPTN